MKTKIPFLLLILLLSLYSFNNEAQEGTSCGARAFAVEYPRVDADLYCVEHPPLESFEAGEWAFTALAFTEDGSFYATRPHTGELLQLSDSDSDSLPDTVNIVASGMRLPNGLAADGNRLFIIGDGIVYRYEAGELSIVTEALPQGRGFMPSAILVHEGQLYIGVPFPCDVCEADDERHGTVIRMDLSGENQEILARGLRYPAALAVYQNALYVSDAGRDYLDIRYGDEINRIELNMDETPHFGFPYCVGSANTADFEGNFDCARATVPYWVLPTGSIPLSLEAYQGDTFPWLNQRLLVVLSGSPDNSYIQGHSILALREAENTLYSETLVPVDMRIAGSALSQTNNRAIRNLTAERINRRGAGTWPHRIYGLAVSPQGWLYFSVAEENLYVLREGNLPAQEICESLRTC